MSDILILKTAALGDVLRTTSILPGLRERDPEARVTWVTAPAALDLVERHPLVERVLTVDPGDAAATEGLARELGQTRWARVLSFDDEEPLCRLATAMDTDRLSGAYLTTAGTRAYTGDVAPWFDMGLLSTHGKDTADRLKVENQRSHATIFADMLDVPMGKPELVLPDAAAVFARRFAEREALATGGPVIGLNTGAGGRWRTKALSVERTIEVASQVSRGRGGAGTFLVLGGEPEAERNGRILEGLRALHPAVRVADAGTGNSIAEFAALVDLCDVLLTSDSLALHVGVARRIPIVAFFAPTSAAEIELYGLGEKVRSTTPDYCSYRPDADNSTITPAQLSEGLLRQLARTRP
jgi:heptosyltransferase-2